jgi:hypothetical protein
MMLSLRCVNYNLSIDKYDYENCPFLTSEALSWGWSIAWID